MFFIITHAKHTFKLLSTFWHFLGTLSNYTNFIHTHRLIYTQLYSHIYTTNRNKLVQFCHNIFVCQSTISHQLLEILTVGSFRSHKLEVSWRHTLPNTNNLVPVMLCQYRRTQDRCCYYFVISKFCSSLRTSEILLPCTRMSTNGRSVGEEQQICYHWQRVVIDSRAGEHPQSSRLQAVVKVWWHSQCTYEDNSHRNKSWMSSNIVKKTFLIIAKLECSYGDFELELSSFTTNLHFHL